MNRRKTHTRNHNRRATALIFAVGVLAVVALIALSYVTFVRLDRQSADAVRRALDYEQQVNAVVNHIGELLTADLYNGAVVTRDVPRFPDSNQDRNLWPPQIPTADYPYTHYPSFNEEYTIDQEFQAYDGLRFPSDKAWLASSQPIWNAGQPFWQQFTNLRAAWRYDDNGTPGNPVDDKYVRGDGLYADLAQFFLNTVNVGGINRPDAGIDFTESSLSIPPDQAAGNFTNAPVVPMNFLETPFASTTTRDFIRSSDERFFVDTDGDLYPDARWQVLDSLGNLYGLRWFVAARITDASSRINYNSSIEFGSPSSGQSVADGRTPADVDLFRLIRDACCPTGAAISTYPFDIMNVTFATEGYRTHLRDSLRLPAYFAGAFNVDSWPTTALTRQQRAQLWNEHGSAPYDSGSPEITPYPLTELVDLLAFSGANNQSLLTLSEQAFDGPEFSGLLPTSEDNPGDDLGPMTSKERPAESLRLSLQKAQARPSPEAIRWLPRQHITPVSGVSQASPVPVLNQKAEFLGLNNDRPYLNAAPLRKLSLNYSANDIPDAFAAFMWALAPFATDEYLSRALAEDNLRSDFLTNGDETLFYGYTSMTERADHAIRFGDPLQPFTPPATTSELSVALSFAILQSAALAVNTHDASNGNAPPTSARLIPNTNGDWAYSNVSSTGIPVLGLAFPQGNVTLTPEPKLLGDPVVDTNGYHLAIERNTVSDWLADSATGAGNKGLTIVGLTRNPYIVEIFTLAVYSNVDETTLDLIGPGNQIDTTSADYQIGSIFAVQLANPYPEPIQLSDAYQLRLTKNPSDISSTDPDVAIAFNFPNNPIIPGNSVATFVYATDDFNGDYVGAIAGNNFSPPLTDEADSPQKLLDILSRESRATGAQPMVLDTAFQAALGSELIVFDTFARSTTSTAPPSAILVRTDVNLAPDIALTNSLPIGAVVDKFTIRTTSNFANGRFSASTNLDTFPYVPDANITLDGGVLPDRIEEFFLDPGGVPERWYEPGQISVQNRLDSGLVAGRYMVTTSATRPTESPPNGGTPAYVLDFDYPGGFSNLPVNVVISGFGHAWLTPVGIDPGPPPYSDPQIILDNNGLTFIDLVLEGGLSSGVLNGSFVTPPSGNAAHSLSEVTSKPANDLLTDNFPAWQLFVRSSDLQFLADLHMVSKHAHLCLNNDLTDLHQWCTVGQQIAASLDRSYPVSSFGLIADNPYPATLDPSRYIPNRGGASISDQAFAVPLAVRVFDCFEPLNPLTELVQGRININTATERVIHLLPYLYPDPTKLVPGLTPATERVALLLQYRDSFDPLINNYNAGFSPDIITGFQSPALREGTNAAEFNNATSNLPLGFASIGELAILHQNWNALTGTPNAGGVGFLQLGIDSTQAADQVFSPYGSTTASDPVDDPEERLALFRAISNIVSTRSDVYIATFVLRGYDPDVIESIDITGATESDALDAMNSDDFQPAYQSRWVVVFDRSNVRSPTDRPIILLKAQLPPPAR